MRTYGQYCSLAKALDLLGERWTLLIVRELLLRDTCRYTDLREGLPGIATNLLADRLRDLEEAGVVEREAAPPPIATTVFRLTERGRELRPAIHALGQWGGPLLPADIDDDHVFLDHWLAFPLELGLGDRARDWPPTTIEVRSGGRVLTAEVADGAVHSRAGAAEDPDIVVSGPMRLALAALLGRVPLETARASGLEVTGRRDVLRRLRPPATAAA